MLIYLQMIETDEEKSKFEQIYTTYRGLMFHVAMKLLHSPEDAEDAVSQAFIKVVEHISKISEPVCPKTKQFVVTIVENKAIDMLRAQNKHHTVPLDEVEYGLCSLIDSIDVSGELAQCILKLPAQQRQVIWLKYHHGYNLHEVAKLLNISLAWAQKIDQRAKKKLNELYEEASKIADR